MTKVGKIVLGCLLGLSSLAPAHERLFTYVQEADVLPKGRVEIEQWATNRNGKAVGVYSRWDLRTEFEAGLSETLSGSLYLNWKNEYQSVLDDDPASLTYGSDITTEESGFEGMAFELKYRLLDPEAGPLGAAIYLEPAFGNGEWETELKLILSAKLGENWVAAFNYTAEPEWALEASRQSSELKLETTVGLAYKSGTWAIGLEGRNHTEFPDFDTPSSGYQKNSAWFIGPTLHTAQEKWWATLTVLPQVGAWPETVKGDGRDLADHERIETRLIVGLAL